MKLILCLALAPTLLLAQKPEKLQVAQTRWHLTARPWQPSGFSESKLLDQMEQALTQVATMQYWNASDLKDPKNGAIIDPIDGKELQYGTPLFAFNVAVLLTKDRAQPLAEAAARALDRSTLDISDGPATDYHGEFFCAAMVKAIRVFEANADKYHITADRLATWKKRMSTPREKFMNMKVLQNWRTFAMKGEWLRQQDGYIRDAVPWIEANWTQPKEGNQRERLRRDLDTHKLSPHFFLYHDDTANPETFAYNGAVSANLLDALEAGYNGPSAKEMRAILSHTMRSSLLLMGASGEAPGGGRTGEHVWDDSVYANAFQLMAEASLRDGHTRLAGQYRHAANLLLQSHARFQQEGGLFSITKNQFPFAMKNRYASWSGIANYENFTLTCCAESILARKHDIPEQPAPYEIGGYAISLDPSFANSFLNAGGMQTQICTRGETDNYGNVQWHTLGITRFSRTGFDSRLGPGAGHANPDFSDAISFCPTFLEDGKWIRINRFPKRFEGHFTPSFVHPLIVRGQLVFSPTEGSTGPTFTLDLTLTPDGALVEARSDLTNSQFGLICPLLTFDGKTKLDTSTDGGIASTSFPRADASVSEPDQQNFITLTPGHHLEASLPTVRGGYGDFLPVRVTETRGSAVQLFIYPRSAGDPSALEVRDSFRFIDDGFTSKLGILSGSLYVGRTSAGGFGAAIDLDADEQADIRFDKPCAFVIQLHDGKPTAIETDRPTTATHGEKSIALEAYKPVSLAAKEEK